ncbi:hypothetical protein BV210_05045 [Halorientalis sp. IM1011]|uniref:HFX_2341 family transcriptional regulator domain-containing protein n=1 Tax=Halorientalis sp. IM1011 TaxID=1932360 RepID=UPI00097CCB36|nr:DUF6293 family protein [Halorientalis sp. IM1011]AQL42117.1 hypothetical protein BV210_05045 [Halorientalis sp. IM1011]
MDVSERVHIAPLGFEYDRIVEPAVEYRADRVVLLDFIAEDITRPAYHEDVLADLEAAGIAVEVVDCDLFDLYESMAVIADQIVQYADQDNQVYVNLASGSTITGIAGMIACMVTGTAVPYYVRAEEYASGTEPVGHGMEFAAELPRYPMEGPDPQQVAVLAYLTREYRRCEDGPYTYNVRKDDLIAFGKANDLPFAAAYTGETEKGYYRRLDSHILDPLVEHEYIEIESVGRTKRVVPTEIGRRTARAFSYLLRETAVDIDPDDIATSDRPAGTLGS